MTTLVTIAYGDITPVWELAYKTWVPYCQRHGYLLKVLNHLPVPSMHPSWNKVKAVLDEIQCSTGPVWAVDADMTVADPNRPMETPELASKPVWFSTDWNGICCGLFRIMPGVWQEWLLSCALFCGDVSNPDQFGKGLGCKWEQNAFKVLVREFSNISSKVGLLPPTLVSCQPPDPKALIYHFGFSQSPKTLERIRSIHHL